jgi:hypothetical protein
MKAILTGAAALAAAALACPAAALALDQPVTGTTTSSIGLSAPTTAAFGVSLSPGSTVDSTGGTVTAVDTSPSWTITVKDGAASGANGKMDASTPGVGSCLHSPNELTNALSVSVVPAVTNNAIASTTRTLSSVDQAVASATAVPLAANVFTTTFTQAVGSTEALQAGCIYTMTATYTIA